MGYAYWRKCDFQIHTPRDPNWVGTRPPGVGDQIDESGTKAGEGQVEQARIQWAKEFVNACVDRGLEAIALTDHHEMVMLPYVQNAIAEKKEEDPNFDLWLFPGMELTGNGGRQAIILFDSDLPKDWLQQAQGKLGIVYADLDEKSAKAPRVTQLTFSYADIAKELDTIEGLKGKYIVLPNVSQGGQHTVLTDGNHTDFKRMPYVGGYLDRGQTIHTLSAKNRERLSGQNKQWCDREIYPLPTSDSRSADYAHLGANNTWIKLATPSAEAIRQAFLGNQSRIRIEQPEVPSLVIASVALTNSTILHDSNISLSPELNATIGGRGSGKSSFLEYLSFGLGRSCYDLPRNKFSGTDRLSELVKDTLISKNGSITVNIIQDKAPFKVVRGPVTQYQPQITYPNGSQQTVTVKELRDLFPATVYCQGELSEIGKQTGTRSQLSDLFQFVNLEYKQEDDKLSADIDSAKTKTRTAIQRLTGHWNTQASLRKLHASRDSLKQRIAALEKTLPKQSDDDQAKINYYEQFTEFEGKRLQASKHADQIVEVLTETVRELGYERDLATPLVEEVDQFKRQYETLFLNFSKGIATLKKSIDENRAELAEAEKQWAAKYEAARLARNGVLEKLSEYKTVTSQIIKLNEQLAQIMSQIGDIEIEIKAQGDPSAELEEAVRNLKTLVNLRSQRTREWADEIEQLSSGKIRASVEPAGDISQIKEAIDYVASKTGSQEARRHLQIEEALKTRDIWDWLDLLRSDCLALLYWQQVCAAEGIEKPKCADLIKLIGETDKIQAAIAEHMETTRVEAIAAAVPNPEIALIYRDGAVEMSFEKASEGQRAGALLFMLLEQPGGPLLVDQPEGDLDNKVISELTNKLHTAKQIRQLFFASHNANIVVNGSSELVCHLEVRVDGGRDFDSTGAIDEPSICKLIADTMEGGEKAFIDRKNKYGY